MQLYPILKPELVKIDCSASTSDGILRELLHNLKIKSKIPNEEFIFNRLLEREKLGSTSVGNNSAVPHTKLKEIKEPLISIGTSKKGIIYNEADKEPVHLIFLILSPNASPIVHLQILAAAATLIKKGDPFIRDTLNCTNAEDLIKVIKKYEQTESDD